jgi:hypothetical protein
METFEEYLQGIFMGNNEIGGCPITKDNCEDMFDSWMQGLDVDEWLEYGKDYGDATYSNGQKWGLKMATEVSTKSFDELTNKKDWNEVLEKLTIIK